MVMYVCLGEFLCTMSVHGPAVEPLRPELQAVMSRHIGAENLIFCSAVQALLPCQ